jgi:hypothetical protein
MHITMAPDEWKTFSGLGRCAERYVEFGSGASTVLASMMVKEWVIAFDSSQSWLDRVAAACRESNSALVPTLAHIDIGETSDWGFPKGEASRDRWPLYHSSMWEEERLAQADLYLIDGRFRIACFAQALLHCSDHAFVIFHDYASRPYYHVAGGVAREVLRVDDLSVFMRPASFDRELAQRLIVDHGRDPR